MAKILAVDLGEKRVGLATSDELRIIASPYGWVERSKALEKILDIITKENVDLVLLGLPYLPSGGLGSQASDIETFSQELTKATNVKIEFENEVLTSVEAENRLKKMNLKNYSKGEIDAMAACIFLESYMRKEG